MSSSYTTLGVNENNQIPYLAGDDNIINLTIDPPISVDLSSFNTGQLNPYISGNGNVITISIGDDSYAFKAASISGNILTFTRLGQTSESIELPNSITGISLNERDLSFSYASGDIEKIQLPPFYQGQVTNISYNEDSTLASLTFLDGEQVNYNITYYDNGAIKSIIREE